jgi:hypothetical protein
MPGRIEFVGAGVGPGGYFNGQVLDICRREDCYYARQAAGAACVYRTDVGVGMEAAEHSGVQEARQFYVIDI